MVITLVFTNIVIAGNQRTVANPDVNVEERSVEDIVKNPDDFVSIIPGTNAKKMSSTSRDKSKTVTTLATGIVTDTTETTDLIQFPSNNIDVVKKYNRFSDKQGETKIKKKR